MNQRMFGAVMLLLATIACTCAPLSGAVESALEDVESDVNATLDAEFGDLDATLEAADAGSIQATAEAAVGDTDALQATAEAALDEAGVDTTDACAVITEGAASDVLGVDVTATSQAGGTCSFQAADFSTTISVTIVNNNSAETAQAVLNAQSANFEAEAIEGLGDDAIWLSELGTLAVRSDTTIILAVGANSSGLMTENDQLIDLMELYLNND